MVDESYNEKMIRVSIVMPVYNAQCYLEDSIGDILNQSYRDFELICVNDGSSDDSYKILDDFSKKDKRIRLFNQNNQGGGAARNRGLIEAKGEYIIFLDSDDRFEEKLLEKVVNKADLGKYEVTIFNGDSFDNKTGQRKNAPWLVKGKEEDLGNNPFDIVNTTIWNKLFRIEYVRNQKLCFQNNYVADNVLFCFLAIAYATRIGILNEVLVHYRMNNDQSVTHKSDEYPLDTLEAIKRIKKRLEEDGKYLEKKSIYRDFSSEYIVNRLRVLKTEKGFMDYYNYLHNGGMKELDLDDYFNESNPSSQILNTIQTKTAEEYLLSNRIKMLKSGLLRSENYLISHNKQLDNKKIVIYGGGNVGKDYFYQLIQNKNLKIVGWIDKNYYELGFPFQSPQAIKDVEFDIIIIAVMSELVADSIREGLVNLGIPKEKILWFVPEAI